MYDDPCRRQNLFHHNVSKSSYIIKNTSDLVSIHRGLSFEVLLDIVSMISKFDLRVRIVDPDLGPDSRRSGSCLIFRKYSITN